ncbi:MAG: response regulator transcription factor [Actinomycetota bacterium]|nr:response regulator transcription factor [Actinomycetota bacterium]
MDTTSRTGKGEVLVIEDETHIADIVKMYLEQEGYRVRHAASGEQGLALFEERPANLVVLDIALPGIDGIEVCKRLRATSGVAVLMLTARSEEVDRIVGLEIGADDYMTKPFSPRELVARVKAILRRVDAPTAHSGPLTAGGTTLWPERREVTVDGEPAYLTTKEFDLVAYLVQNKGLVLTRPQIMSAVWGYEFYGGERTIDAHIRTIRKKLGETLPLTTVRGVGYKIEHDRSR